MITNIFKRMFLFVAVSVFSFNLQAADWTMASGYPKSNFHTQNIIKFIDDVKSNTSVNINLNPNDTLIKLDAIKTSLQRGQIPIGEIRLGIYGNEDPMYILAGLLYCTRLFKCLVIKRCSDGISARKICKKRSYDFVYCSMARTRILY